MFIVHRRMTSARCALTALVVMVLIGVATGQTGLDRLVAAAKQEGQLSTIALPHDWCGYGELINSFKQKYGLKVNELNPDAGSGDEIEAIKANIDNPGPQNPDVVDVGFAFGESNKDLFEPYKVSTWDTIPEHQKDPEGYWYGDYYGVLAFEVNADLVANPPTDWADLAKPEYANMVALSGDPRVSNESILSVFAAGLSESGGDPDKAPEAGLKFFAELQKAGNFVPIGGQAAPLAQRQRQLQRVVV